MTSSGLQCRFRDSKTTGVNGCVLDTVGPVGSSSVRHFHYRKLNMFASVPQRTIRQDYRSNEDSADDDFTVMPLGLRLLRYSGLWGDPQRKRSFVFMLLGTILLLIVPKVVLGTGSDSFDSFARSTAEFIFCYNNYLMMAIFAVQRKPFEQLIVAVQQLFDKHRARPTPTSALVVTVNRQIMRYSRLYVIVQGVYFLIFNLLPPVVTYHAYFTTSSNATNVTFLLPVESRFYFMDIRHSIVDYTIFTIVACPAFLFTAYLTVLKGLVFIGIIMYNTLQYQLVSSHVQDLTTHYRTDPALYRRQLTEIVNQHSVATNCTKLLDSVLSLILLVQFTNTVLMCCLFLFYISKNINSGAINVLLLFLALTVENFCFSYFGTKLTEENQAVGGTVYSIPWYKSSPSLQKQLQQMMRHAHKPRGITVGKFYIVDVSSFGQLIKMIFSYYLILKELF
uniref:Odorant receptor n=1 Tax=Anopheles farauti TaxID=69004 RepID=A0A182QD63_9DIPT